MNVATDIIGRFTAVLIKPTLLLIFTAGFFLFLWGLVMFIFKLEGTDHKEGKEHMLWGIVGMFIIISVYGILNLLDSTFNLQSTNPDIGRMQNLLPSGSVR